jgi:hypothetical protein
MNENDIYRSILILLILNHSNKLSPGDEVMVQDVLLQFSRSNQCRNAKIFEVIPAHFEKDSVLVLIF